MTDRLNDHLRRFAAETLTTDTIVAPDGSIWSHACTMGQYSRGGESFTLDPAAVRNFVRVFNGGYPGKVPVDYEHASTSNDPEIRKLRARGEVPKAGDVLELTGVYGVGDFTGSLKQAAETLAAKANPPRQLDDPRNFGLWMRWKPTAKALEKIRAGEFSELSITWVDNWPDKSNGTDQGPTLLAVALTALPFLDEMLPIAASRGGGRWQQDPADGDASAHTDSREESMTRTISMFAAVAALAAKPVTNEEEAITELTALQPDVTRLRKLSTIVSERFGGETDPEKIGAKITELTTAVATHRAEAEKAKEQRIAADVEAGIKEFERKITPAVKPIYENALKSELTSGTALKECPTYKALSTLPDLGIAGQSSIADERGEGGGIPGGSDPDAQLTRVADELYETDSEVKELRAKDPVKARDLAYDKAAKKIKYTSPQQQRARGL